MYTCTLFIVRVELVRRRGISGRGDVINSVSSYNLSETIKVSLLTSLFHPSHPFHVDMRRGDRANDQFDFLLFITRCISTNLLIRGDVLVLDNASIHKADNILLPLHMLLNTAGITMWFLPTYSLNSTHVNLFLHNAKSICAIIDACICHSGMKSQWDWHKLHTCTCTIVTSNQYGIHDICITHQQLACACHVMSCHVMCM